MTEFRNIQKVIVEFKDREGVPNALILDNVPESAHAALTVMTDGLSFDFELEASEIDNVAGAYHFKSLEDWTLVYRRREQDGQGVANKGELGRVGKAILTVVSLAIVTPFIAILWGWAGEVFRSFG